MFGAAVDFNAAADRLAVGASGSIVSASSFGEVRVFDFDGADWNLVGSSIQNNQGEDNFGQWVSISEDGSTFAAASIGFSTGAGFVQTYEFTSGSWSQKGQTLSGTSPDDAYGASVTLGDNGTYLIFGSPGDDSNGGFVETYTFDTDQWVSFGSPLLSEDVPGAFFGGRISVNADASILAVSEAGALFQGKIYFYDRTDTGWQQRTQILEGGIPVDGLGLSIALDAAGDTLIAGALGGGDVGTGYVRTYVDETLSTIDLTDTQLTIYPNPVSDVLRISNIDELGIEEVSIYNQLGQLVKSLESAGSSIDVSSLPSGTYYLQLKTANGLSSKKFIKN